MAGSPARGFRRRVPRRPGPGSEPDDHPVREGHLGFTNPLLDCEVDSERFGRELRPFRDELVRLADELVAEGRAAQVAFYFRDLDNGPWFGLNESVGFTPASLFKVPLLVACLKQAEGDPSLLSRQLVFDGEIAGSHSLGGYRVDSEMKVGESYTVDNLLLRTSAMSDNYSMAMLYRIVDKAILRDLLDTLGLSPRDAGSDPRPTELSAIGYGRLFRVLYNASYLNREMSDRALWYLSRSVYEEGMRAAVPARVPVAHKFGVSTYGQARTHALQLHDCGIVYHPARPYLLCVMTRGANQEDLSLVIREISRRVYREVDRQAASQ